MRLSDEGEMNDYVLKRRTIVIRHSSGDRIIALAELVSPGNKSARHAIRSFVEKAVEALYRGYHLLIVDLFPCGPVGLEPLVQLEGAVVVVRHIGPRSSLVGMVADPPRSRTIARHSGASRARAVANVGPGAAIQSPGHMSVVGT